MSHASTAPATCESLHATIVKHARLRDVVIIAASCAVDYPPLNDGRCTPLQIQITPATTG